MSPAATIGGVVLAHHGGWDEILVVLLPIAIFVSLLSARNRRGTRSPGGRGAGADHGAAAPAPPEPPEPPAGS